MYISLVVHDPESKLAVIVGGFDLISTFLAASIDHITTIEHGFPVVVKGGIVAPIGLTPTSMEVNMHKA